MFGSKIIATFFPILSSGKVLPRLFHLSLIAFLLSCQSGYTQQIIISDQHTSVLISTSLEEMVDVDKVSTPAEAANSAAFNKTKGNIPVYPNGVKSVWLKFSVNNQSSSEKLYLNIAYPNLSKVSLYSIDSLSGKTNLVGEEGNEVPPSFKIDGSPNLVFDLSVARGKRQTFLLHVNSRQPILVPGEIYTYDAIHKSVNFQTTVTGLYLGVLAVMFFYNLFLFFGTRDKSYLYYIIYIFFLALAQTTIAGYDYLYLWPEHPGLNRYSVVVTSSLSAMSGLLFSMHFLHTSFYTPRMHKWLQFLVFIYLLGMVLSFFNAQDISYNILNFNGLISVLSVLSTSLIIARKGFRPAYFYLIAWLLLLVSFSILILRNLSIIPYNNFTTYVIYLGSGIEVALLSIALADKINSLRKEKEQSQAEALKASLENEKLVRDQNVMLERKVAERTVELQSSNTNLSTALQDLKDTQIQLVEAEKMASLGQLTAGIAHEINNPINFVKSNIKPLQLDINDLLEVIDEYDKLHTLDSNAMADQLEAVQQLKKQIDIDYVKSEIENLVKGIKDGAERTAEIVLGLRNFSRLDESEIKRVNIHEGIDSTLVILKNSIPENISIKKDFQANGNIECLPGKLNQVFMNILNNGIQAIKEKKEPNEQEYLSISTRDVGDQIEIRIGDTGIGMTEEVRHKIFDPFFTTKDVGEGTGLGLSIVFKIIQRHEGKIDVISSKGNGSEFIITLFHTLPESVIS